MKRRTFLKMIAGAVAVGMMPIGLNRTVLEVVKSKQVAMGRLYVNGELVAENPIVDTGVNRTATVPLEWSGTVEEVGICDPDLTDGYLRYELKNPITVTECDTLHCTYEVRI